LYNQIKNKNPYLQKSIRTKSQLNVTSKSERKSSEREITYRLSSQSTLGTHIKEREIERPEIGWDFKKE
jgi:hypothetical protein